MLRLRRYRIFLVTTIFAGIALYQLTTIRRWNPTSPTPAGSWKGHKVDEEQQQQRKKPLSVDEVATPPWKANLPDPKPDPEPVEDISKSGLATTGSASRSNEATSEVVAESATTSSRSSSRSASSVSSTVEPAMTPTPVSAKVPDAAFVPPPYGHPNDGQGRLEAAPTSAKKPRVHWKKFPEHYPVPLESIIPLPTAKPIVIPSIQHEAIAETPARKAEREIRLAAVKEALNHTWTGYKTHAWMHDELNPVSGESRDPFCGWAATLVDTLDTLWIMGFTEEFEEAVKAVDQIDFTTSRRDDIPLFETTIRYLGGLLGAYDISEEKYRNLLDKAVELAEVLMAAFDTPNRMPVTFYHWKPLSASKPRRAGRNVVLSEIGSLSVEFTRLAQITKEPRYYDAVARITNEFEMWQNHTRLPGMWPANVDASGCNRTELVPDLPPSRLKSAPSRDGQSQEAVLQSETKTEPPKVEAVGGHHLGWDSKSKREVIDSNSTQESAGRQIGQSVASQSKLVVDEMASCRPQGLASPPISQETFTLGALSDSMYEYLPKEYMLLGGVNDQYRKMYQQTIEVIKRNLFFRPMLPDSRDILMSGTLIVSANQKPQLVAEGTHLTCFAGGMLAIASKIFDRPEELTLASKLADGCVWAYESTQTGIMPEGFVVVACEDFATCTWNESKYWDAIDPYHDSRVERRLKQASQAQQVTLAAALLSKDTNTTTMATELTEKKNKVDDDLTYASLKKNKIKRGTDSKGAKVDNDDDHQPSTDSEKKSTNDNNLPLTIPGTPTIPRRPQHDQDVIDDQAGSGYHYVSRRPSSREEYVKKRIEEERLPAGMIGFQSRKYILRPEAIESVFIMYRITGDHQWQEKGWQMFQAIQSHTRTQLAFTAIADVTSSAPFPRQEMESFWSAETLKYFYLLFSDVDLVSLDHWVFNTEAHPLRRPLPVK